MEKSVGSMHFRKLSPAQFEILVEKQKEKEVIKSTKQGEFLLYLIQVLATPPRGASLYFPPNLFL